MLVTTHTLIATTIAVKTKNPYVYIPAALLNHFILDALPHFGSKKIADSKGLFLITAAIDAAMGITLFFLVVYYLHFPPVQLFLIDLAAGWPDFMNLYQVLGGGKFVARFQNWHSKIQRLETPAGIIVEVFIWIVCLIALV